ncbi:MAG: N-acetylglucosamine-6-phosphate deacetylase [Selenomonadaceae bacterium]|nr:N-acetylglucosamine-6-phosphate deacetylase [Selenomonadaceae bacterium]
MKRAGRKAVIHASLIVPDANGAFVVRESCAMLYGTHIEGILPMEAFRPDMADEIYDAQGKYVSPGFIDVHIHGGVGHDTMDETDEALPAMRAFQAKSGVTGFLPTTMTYDMPRIHRALERIRGEMGKPGGARVLGAHMEGPFIHPRQKGAQSERFIQKADYAHLAGYEDVVRILTAAPETIEDFRFVEQCRAAGIIVSIGHSTADYATAMEAIETHDMRHITHLFNAQTGFHHRRPGIVGAAFDTDAVCELIADNVHTSPTAQRLTWHAKQGKHIVLITDALRACGLGDGESELGGQKVLVKGTLATLEDGTIAGSVLTMNEGLRIFRENIGASIPEVVELVTKNPAEELGIYGKLGSLTEGKLADFTVFDEAFCIGCTVVDGKTEGGSPCCFNT